MEFLNKFFIFARVGNKNLILHDSQSRAFPQEQSFLHCRLYYDAVPEWCERTALDHHKNKQSTLNEEPKARNPAIATSIYSVPW